MNSMLSIAKFDEGKLTIDKEEVDPEDLLDELQENQSLYIEKKKINYSSESTLNSGEKLYIDKEKMMSVLNNIVQNAIKFTNESGKIHVSIGEKGNDHLIKVTDNGKGISEKNQQGIFDAFSLSSKGTEKEKGTGLGLWVARVFTELHHGSISLSSKEGEGTVVRIAIPKETPIQE
jgi:signal transduction histidine kinase